jgi:hypothetical protein
VVFGRAAWALAFGSLVVVALVAGGCGSSPVATPGSVSRPIPISAPTVFKLQFSPLKPSSCMVDNGTVTAKGTFDPEFIGTNLGQSGKFIVLYLYTDALNTGTHQLVDLTTEHPLPIPRSPMNPWRVTGKLTRNPPSSASCVVIVQPRPGVALHLPLSTA